MSIKFTEHNLSKNTLTILTIVTKWHDDGDDHSKIYAKESSAEIDTSNLTDALTMQYNIMKDDLYKNNNNLKNANKIWIPLATWCIITSHKSLHFTFEYYEDLNILFQTIKDTIPQIIDQIMSAK